MVQKISKEILRPLNKLKQKQDLCIKDIARGLVQAKRNADKIHNIDKDSVAIFKDCVKTLKQEYRISLSSNQVRNFAKLLEECQKDTKAHWFANFQAKKNRSLHEKEDKENENFSVGVGLAVLEGVCGGLIIALGLWAGRVNKNAGIGLGTFGIGLLQDAAQKLFKEETYEKEPKKNKTH